jgi:hypothetical protein
LWTSAATCTVNTVEIGPKSIGVAQLSKGKPAIREKNTSALVYSKEKTKVWTRQNRGIRKFAYKLMMVGQLIIWLVISVEAAIHSG